MKMPLFDVEVLDKKECNVYIVDPTPRALKHFDKIKNNFGSNKKVAYSNSGNQPIESYNLRKVNNQNFILIKKLYLTQVYLKLNYTSLMMITLFLPL